MMAARYIIFDGHIPVVFPQGISHNLMTYAITDHSLGETVTSLGECYYDSDIGWHCRCFVQDFGYAVSKADAEILNRHLCN